MDAHIAQGLKLGLLVASRLHSGQPTSAAYMDPQRDSIKQVSYLMQTSVSVDIVISKKN